MTPCFVVIKNKNKLQHGIAAMALLTKQLIINPTEYMSRAEFTGMGGGGGDQLGKQPTIAGTSSNKPSEARLDSAMSALDKKPPASSDNAVVSLPKLSAPPLLHTATKPENKPHPSSYSSTPEDFVVTHL